MSATLKSRVHDIAAGRAAYPVKTRDLWAPSLEDVAIYVEKELSKNYRNVKVCTW